MTGMVQPKVTFNSKRIDPTVDNGLSKSSSVDTLQLRGADTQRFIKKLGVLSPDEIASMTIAIVT
jgi:mRNA interferase MazF